jgi:hypothetical protein
LGFGGLGVGRGQQGWDLELKVLMKEGDSYMYEMRTFFGSLYD